MLAALTILVALCCLAPFVAELRQRPVDLLQPVHIYAGLFFLYYVLRVAYLSAQPATPVLFPSLDRDFVQDDDTLLCLIYAVGGLVAFYCGYYLTFRQPRPRVVGRRSHYVTASSFPKSKVIYGIVLYTIGLTGTIISLKTGQFLFFARESIDPAWVYPLRLLNSFRLFGLIVLLQERYSTTSRRPRRVAAILLVCEFVLTMLDGSKENLLRLAFVVIAVRFYACRTRIKKTAIALGALVIFLSFAFFNQYRAGYSSSYGHDSVSSLEGLTRVASSILATAKGWSGSDVTTTGESAIDTFSNRFAGVDSLVAGIRFAPAVGFQMGRTIWPGLLAPIPRFLWHGKPASDYGQWFQSNFAGVAWDYPSRTGVTALTDLYLNFGPLGIFFGMALLGVVLRYLYWRFIGSPGQTSSSNLFLYLVLAQPLLRYESPTGGLFGELLILLILTRILVRPLREPSSVRGRSRQRIRETVSTPAGFVRVPRFIAGRSLAGLTIDRKRSRIVAVYRSLQPRHGDS